MPVKKVHERFDITYQISYTSLENVITILIEMRQKHPDARIEIDADCNCSYADEYDSKAMASVMICYDRDETNDERRNRIRESRAASKRRRERLTPPYRVYRLLTMLPIVLESTYHLGQYVFASTSRQDEKLV
jgi:hypothetical protein